MEEQALIDAIQAVVEADSSRVEVYDNAIVITVADTKSRVVYRKP